MSDPSQLASAFNFNLMNAIGGSINIPLQSGYNSDFTELLYDSTPAPLTFGVVSEGYYNSLTTETVTGMAEEEAEGTVRFDLGLPSFYDQDSVFAITVVVQPIVSGLGESAGRLFMQGSVLSFFGGGLTTVPCTFSATRGDIGTSTLSISIDPTGPFQSVTFYVHAPKEGDPSARSIGPGSRISLSLSAIMTAGVDGVESTVSAKLHDITLTLLSVGDFA